MVERQSESQNVNAGCRVGCRMGCGYHPPYTLPGVKVTVTVMVHKMICRRTAAFPCFCRLGLLAGTWVLSRSLKCTEGSVGPVCWVVGLVRVRVMFGVRTRIGIRIVIRLTIRVR